MEYEYTLEKIEKTKDITLSIDTNKKGAKKFKTFFENEFTEWYKVLENKNVYEIIGSDRKSALYFDIDINLDDCISSGESILFNFLDNIKDYLTIVIGKHISNPQISQSHSTKKYSYHLVYKNIILENHMQRKEFAKEFNSFLPNNLLNFFVLFLYSRNRSFRILYSSKYGQYRPLIPCNILPNVSTNLCDHLVTLNFNEESYILHYDIIPEKVTNVIVTNNERNITKLLDCIDCKYWADRQSWLRIASSLKNSKFSFELFDKYSKLKSPENYGGTYELWNSINDRFCNKSTLGTLYHYANESQLNDIKGITTITEKQQYYVKLILQGKVTHSLFANMLYEEYKEAYIYGNSKWYKQCSDSGRYLQLSSDSDTIICKHISDFFEHFEREIIPQFTNDADRKILFKANNMTEKYEYKVSIIKELKIKYYKPGIDDLFDSKQHLIGFKNGVFDLELNEFRKATIDDYVSWSVGYDYNPANITEIEYIENFIYSLFSSKDTGRYFLKHLASHLHGGNTEELIHFWTSSGRNGKGTVDYLLSLALGPYYQILDNSYYLTSTKNQEAASPAMLSLRNVRLSMTSETEYSQAYLSSQFKRISGNDPIKGRTLYKSDMITFRPTFKPIIQTNSLPCFTDIDIGLLQRIRVIQFSYTFVQKHELDKNNPSFKLIDLSLKDKLKNLGPDFMSVLLKWYYVYKSETINTPSSDISCATDSYRKDIDSISSFMDIATERSSSNDDYITIIELLYNYNGYSKTKTTRTQLQNRLKHIYTIKPMKLDGNKNIQCVIGVKWTSDFI